MYISLFPGCCGAQILFNLTPHLKLITPTDDSEPDDFFGYDENDAPNENGTFEDLPDKCTFAATIEIQTESITWLKKKGFVEIYKFKNPNTDNFVTIWARSPDDESGENL